MKFTTLSSIVAPSLAGLMLLAGCSNPAPPPDNAPVVAGDPLGVRPVRVGTEGPSLPACSSLSRVQDGGTDVYWAPNETRAVKANLAGGQSVSVCEAAENDEWFGVVFPAPRTDPDMCGITRSVASPQEYQGPCRWGWIRGGSVRIGN